jgi:ADP-heptose:LPS heptosyltransferase
LRKTFPDARIDCIAPPAFSGLESFFPWLDEIIPFRCPWSPQYDDYSFKNMYVMTNLIRSLRRKKYEFGFDLRGDLRDIFFLYCTGATYRVAFDITGGSELLTHVVPFKNKPFRHQVEGNVLVASYPFSREIEPSEFYPEIRIPPEWRQAARNWLNIRGLRAFVGVHPGASLPHRRWRVSSWVELLDKILLPRLPVVLFGAGHESHLVDEIITRLIHKKRVYRAHVSLELFFALTSLAKGMICLDSMASHLAAATTVPVVSLRGSTPAELSRPYSSRSREVYIENMPCRPCFKVCTQKQNTCMQDITVSTVASAIQDLGFLC